MNTTKLDAILILACSVWTPSDQILYPIRKLYPKGTKFHTFRIHHTKRILLTASIKTELLDLVEQLIQSLPTDNYLPSYYAVMLKERISEALIGKEC